MLAIYTYNFLNCDDNLKSPIDKYLVQNRPAAPDHLVLYKAPLGEGKWEGPVALLTWGRGYACVFSPEGPLEPSAKRVKPYHRKGFPGGKPPPPHWTLPIQTSPSCTSPTLKWNSCQCSWTNIQHHLRGTFYTSLKGQIDKSQPELHQQLQDIQCLTK